MQDLQGQTGPGCVFSWQGAVGRSVWLGTPRLPEAGPKSTLATRTQPCPHVHPSTHMHTYTHTHMLLPQEQGRQRPDDKATGFSLPQRGKVVSSASLVLASCAGSQGGCAAERGRLHGAGGKVHGRKRTHGRAHNATGSPPRLGTLQIHDGQMNNREPLNPVKSVGLLLLFGFL